MAHRKAKALRPVLRPFHASLSAKRPIAHERSRTFGHGVQAFPLPYQPVSGHCTLQLSRRKSGRGEST